jgi:hypothetical protein
MLLGVGMSGKEWELVNEMDTTNADKKIRFPRNNKNQNKTQLHSNR